MKNQESSSLYAYLASKSDSDSVGSSLELFVPQVSVIFGRGTKNVPGTSAQELQSALVLPVN